MVPISSKKHASTMLGLVLMTGSYRGRTELNETYGGGEGGGGEGGGIGGGGNGAATKLDPYISMSSSATSLSKLEPLTATKRTCMFCAAEHRVHRVKTKCTHTC